MEIYLLSFGNKLFGYLELWLKYSFILMKQVEFSFMKVKLIVQVVLEVISSLLIPAQRKHKRRNI